MMKLLKAVPCLYGTAGGNVNIQTTLVEVQGIGLWTRVRFPSTPSKPGSWDIRYDIVIWKNRSGALKEIKITALYIDSDMQCRYFYCIMRI